MLIAFWVALVRTPCGIVADGSSSTGHLAGAFVLPVCGQCVSVHYVSVLMSQWHARQMEDRIENLLEAGVLDPAKVTRSGLQNACGIAGIMLTTQARRCCLAPKVPMPSSGVSQG